MKVSQPVERVEAEQRADEVPARRLLVEPRLADLRGAMARYYSSENLV
jgi:hypothetical protein